MMLGPNQLAWCRSNIVLFEQMESLYMNRFKRGIYV